MERARAATRTELAILGLLAWSGESSGYELSKRAERTLAYVWAPARSQLYAVLKSLAADGLIAGRDVVQADRPDKRLFRITEAGMTTLRAWLETLEPIEPEDRDGVLLKLFFGAFGDPDAGRRQLVDYRSRVETRLARYHDIERSFDAEPDDAAIRRLQSLRLGIALMEASLAWADQTLSVLGTDSGANHPSRPTAARSANRGA
jgi:DNA-binding PadR family transcriptional regulator